MGIPLDYCLCVLARSGQKKVIARSQVTIVRCINAIGQAIPPFTFIVLDVNNLNIQWGEGEGEVPRTTYGLSNCGWMYMILFI